MIFRGHFTRTASPAIWTTVRIENPTLPAERVEFLLDTGAMFSVLHPKDALALGLDLAFVATAGTETGSGVGGTARYAIVQARLRLNAAATRAGVLDVDLHVAVPTKDNLDFPSFLGMDVISLFKLTVGFPGQQVELEYAD